MSDQTSRRRPGRPRIQRTDPLRRTTIMLPESLLTAIDRNLGEIASASSRNRWLMDAAEAYLHRATERATHDDWRDLRAYVQEQRDAARRADSALQRAVQAVDDTELAPLSHVHATLTEEQRRYVEVLTRSIALEGDQGRWAVVGGELSAILARMDQAEQWSDAATHPVEHQE